MLDEGPRQAKPRVAALAAGAFVSASFTVLRQALGWIPETFNFTFITPHAAVLRVGTEIGVLSLGAGMLIGLRVTLSMGPGMVLAWVVDAGPVLPAARVRPLHFA